MPSVAPLALAAVLSLTAPADVDFDWLKPLLPQSVQASPSERTDLARDSFDVEMLSVVSWPVPYSFSSGYGSRPCPDPEQPPDCRTWHGGLDLDPGAGTPIKSIADGVVVDSGFNPDGYGHYVIIRHQIDGAVVDSLYAHMRARALVAIGEQVDRGTVLGAIGESGYAFGAHLHFEIRVNGTTVDPLRWMNEHDPLPYP